MVDVGKREDQLLDKIAGLIRGRKAVKDWLDIYQEANLISPEVAAHLWEVLIEEDEVKV